MWGGCVGVYVYVWGGVYVGCVGVCVGGWVCVWVWVWVGGWVGVGECGQRGLVLCNWWSSYARPDRTVCMYDIANVTSLARICTICTQKHSTEKL